MSDAFTLEIWKAAVNSGQTQESFSVWREKRRQTMDEAMRYKEWDVRVRGTCDVEGYVRVVAQSELEALVAGGRMSDCEVNWDSDQGSHRQLRAYAAVLVK